MNFDSNDTTQQATQFFDQWNLSTTTTNDQDQDTRSRNSSMNLISPTSGSMDGVFNGSVNLSAPGKDINPSNFLNNVYGYSTSSSGSISDSGSSFQNIFNNIQTPLPNAACNDDFMSNFQDRESLLRPASRYTEADV
jgi:hypothetical protein